MKKMLLALVMLSCCLTEGHSLLRKMECPDSLRAREKKKPAAVDKTRKARKTPAPAADEPLRVQPISLFNIQ